MISLRHSFRDWLIQQQQKQQNAAAAAAASTHSGGMVMGGQGSLSLEDYLIMPIQRIPRYLLRPTIAS